ncbi:MAG: Clp protease ClpP [Rikenellaceae bacterium]
MEQGIKIKNSLDVCTIDIEGTIGVCEQWQFSDPQQRVATYETFRAQLELIKELDAQSVVVNIRSTGGDVNDALLIYEALLSLNVPITTRCYGYVASAATVIAQAASEGQREIAATALYLIHNSSCAVEGNADGLAARAELLKKTDEQLAALYARRSGGEVEDFVALMGEDSGNGRWLSPKEAVELSLADAIIEVPQSGASQDSSVVAMIRQIGEKLGLVASSDEKQDIEHSVLHEPMESIEQREAMVSTVALEEGQRYVEPTHVKEVEDASVGEPMQSANSLAYEHDAMRFSR